MIIQIKVKTNSRQESVTETAPGHFRVCVNAPPREGKANERIVELLAGYFGVPKSKISIRRGERSVNKTVEVLD